MTADRRGPGPGQAVPAPLGAAGLHPGDPRRAGSPAWSGPTAPARPPCSAWPSACWPRRRARSRSAAAARRRTRPSWPRSASSPRTPRRTRRSASPTTCGWARTSTRAGTTRSARRRVERLGLDPTRRPAKLSGGQRAQLALTLGAGQAARAADPRRAGRQPRPAGPPGVPAGADGGGRRARGQRAALLARRLRPRAGLRPPRRAGRLPGPRRRATSRRCSPPTTGSPGRAATRPRCRRPARRLGQPHRPADHARRAHRRPGPRPGLDGRPARPGGPRAGLHGRGGRRRAPGPRRWRCSDDLADLAAVPRPGRRRRRPSSPAALARRGSPSPAHGWPTSPDAARDVFDHLTSTDRTLFYAGIVVLAVAPALIGVFWGAPLVARELETGTASAGLDPVGHPHPWLAASSASRGAGDRRSSSRRSPWRSPGGPRPLDGAVSSNPGRLPARLTPSPSRCAASSPSATPCSRSSSASPSGACCAGRCPRWRSPSRSTSSSRSPCRSGSARTSCRRSPASSPITGARFDGDLARRGAAADVTVHTTRPQRLDPDQRDRRRASVTSPRCRRGSRAACRPAPPATAAGTVRASSSPGRLPHPAHGRGYRQQVVYQPADRFWPLQWAETACTWRPSALLPASRSGGCADASPDGSER